MIVLLAVLVFLVFGIFGLMFVNLAWRALEALLLGMIAAIVRFAQAALWTAKTTRRAWSGFKRLQIATAQRLYAWWFGYYWRWQRRYIARALRARRAARHA